MKKFVNFIMNPVSPSTLREAGILGMNRRNAEFILHHNDREHYPRVDDKVLTKKLCEGAGIPLPETYAIIERYGDLQQLPAIVEERQSFVIKPAHGAGGRGIMVVLDHDGESFTTASRKSLSFADLRYHMSTILTGLYSLGGHADSVILEKRIICHPVFSSIAVGGTPDIRIIVYRGVPVMAMMRLPTKASRGRANLHQGAIGAGVNLATGQTIGGVCRNQAMSTHPDTGGTIDGFQIPGWQGMLDIAVRLAQTLDLGYVGVDLVIDADDGALVLEANARPGLSIQIANRRGLLARLRAVDALPELPAPDDIQTRHQLTANLAQM